MAFLLKDRVKETSTTTGTVAYVLLGAVTGFQAFSVIGNGSTIFYAAVDAATGDWEVGLGTWSTGGNLARTSILASSNAGAAVSWVAGTRIVFSDIPAALFSAAVCTFLLTPSSANLAALLTDETGTGAAVFAGSPALTGNPTAPTQTALDSSTKLATTAYADAAVAAAPASSPIPTSATYAVGDSAMLASTTGSVASGSTKAGSGLVSVVFTFTAAGAMSATAAVTNGGVQTGTWKNISGATLSAGQATNSNGGRFVRTV